MGFKLRKRLHYSAVLVLLCGAVYSGILGFSALITAVTQPEVTTGEWNARLEWLDIYSRLGLPRSHMADNWSLWPQVVLSIAFFALCIYEAKREFSKGARAGD